EQRGEKRTVPDQRIERREERDGRRRLRRLDERLDLVTDPKPLAAHAFDGPRYQFAALDQLLAQHRSSRELRIPRVRLGGAEPAEDVSAAAGAQEAVRAIP